MSDEISTTAEAMEGTVFPDAGAIRSDCANGACTELQPLPKEVAEKPAANKSPAEWAYERLILYIKNFEETLDKEQEVAMGFAGSDAGMVHIQGIGFFAPDILSFYGRKDNGAPAQLVQHVSQLNVMLTAAPKIAEEPVRIGFRLAANRPDAEGE